MYLHLTEIQKVNYFHSLLRGNALQVYCNLEDANEDNLEEVITAFKRRFGDFQSSAKARCEWDALHFDPTKQKLHEFLDTLQKTAKEAFGSEAQKFVDKAIYAKMPEHVKKILNRAYLETKPYNDIVGHLELMLFLPVEFNTVKIDALVGSGAYIDANSEGHAEKLRQDAIQCIINKAPPPPFKVQYANAELEQPLATNTLRFKIGD